MCCLPTGRSSSARRVNTPIRVFNLFSFPVLKGDPKTALNDIHSVW